MNTSIENQPPWKSRDAWFCILALVICQFVILFWLRFAARSSPAFDHWWMSSFGTGVIDLVQDSLWIFVALWFSRINAIQDFLTPAGLRCRISSFGWCAAWLAIAIALVDAYGASRGLTASSRLHQHADYDGLSVAWWYFTLSAVLIAPFCEEVAARGFLYPAFRSSYSFLVTTIIIICFSAYFHWNSVSRSLFTFGCLATLWGLLCIIRERTGSLWDCLLCHAVYNLVGIHHWISAVVVVLLFLPSVMFSILVKRRRSNLVASRRDYLPIF